MLHFLKEHSGVFDPDEVHTLVAAFDKAWQTVRASGVIYPEPQAEAARAILAKHIIAAAMDGERDYARLRDGALLALAQSDLRTAPRPVDGATFCLPPDHELEHGAEVSINRIAIAASLTLLPSNLDPKQVLSQCLRGVRYFVPNGFSECESIEVPSRWRAIS